MSTIVVARKNGTVTIGADTLTKHGYTRQNAYLIANHSKLLKVGESFVAITGDASLNLVLADYFGRSKRPPSLDSPEAIFSFARDMHASLRDEYFLNPKEDEKDPFESSQLDCLIANPAGIFGLYSLRSVDEFTRFYAFGSGRQYAIGAMHATFESADSAETLCRAGLEAAAEFDDDTGRPLEIHTIALKGEEGK
jgi:ATP-dependent protease HslVU (ClpYQ) peptidase subunit